MKQINLLFVIIGLLILTPFVFIGQEPEDDEPTPTPPLVEPPAPVPPKGDQSPEDLYLTGNYTESIKAYESLIQKNPEDYQTQLALSRVYLETGKYDECRKIYDVVLKAEAANQTALVGTAELLFLKGDYQKAEESFQSILKADEKNLKARYLLCQLLLETGKYDEAEKTAEFFTKLNEADIGKLTGEGLITFAQGLWFYGTRKGDKDIFHFVNNLFLALENEESLTWSKKTPSFYTTWGFCYLDKDDLPQAGECFADALKINPHYPPAHLGMAYCALVENPGAARGGAQKALSVNPNYLDALDLLATSFLAEEQEEAALKEVEKALKINPNSVSALATRASVYYLNNDLKEFESACQDILKINPKPARFYYILGRNCASIFRMLYLDAQPFYQKAVELDPKFWEGYIALGMNGLKCGPEAEAEARKLLEEAHNRDPFHPTVKNSLKVLDAIDEEFVPIKTEHFVIKLNRSEAELLAPYITDLLERAYKQFTGLYKFEPVNPVLCEVFPSMNDFSARMMGIPDVDFALGVCFARTFLVYSPEVQEKLRRRFHWGTVTVHEFMHIITLQLSKFRVPRWFTEGCSVWSEKLLNPGWGRELEMEIYTASESGKLQHLDKFAQAKGGDLLHTYLLSSIIIEYIYQKYGMDKINALLKGFGDRKKQDVVFKECLGKNLKEFDKEFFDYFQKEWLKRIKIRKPPRLKEEKVLRERLAKNIEDEEALAAVARIALSKGNFLEAHDLADKAIGVNPKNTEALITLGEIFFSSTKRRYETALDYFSQAVKSGADDFGTHFKLAISYMKTDQPDAAIREFNLAKERFPSYVKYEDNPYYYLAQIYEKKNDKEKMFAELEQYVKIAHEDFTTQMKLAKTYREHDQYDQLINLLENTVYLDPKDLKLHGWLAESYRAKKDYEKALREYNINIFLLNQLDESDKRNKWLSNFYCDTTEIYLETNERGKARQALRLAKEIYPDNERLPDLLDKIGE